MTMFGSNGVTPLDGAGDVAGRLRAVLRAALAKRLPARSRESGFPAGSGPDHQHRRRVAREVLTEALAEHTTAEITAGRPLPDQHTERAVLLSVENELFGLAGLQPLLDDPAVETVNVNRWDRVFVRYADGRREQVAPVAGSNEELTDLVRALAARAGSEERRFDRGSPEVNVQLPGGERLWAVMAVTESGYTALSIRRHGYRVVTLEQLREVGTLSGELLAFITAMVRARKNLLIVGGTEVGKTTTLRALASVIDPAERIVTIEDAFELGLGVDDKRHPDVIALQARQPNVEGFGGISQAEMVRWALRMSPDRVIVGEVRGPEVIPMCNAMSQGNDGSMATVHASSSQQAFLKLAAYAYQGAERLPIEATNLLVASAVHFVIHLDRTKDPSRTRVVSSIREVVGAEGDQIVSNEIYRPGRDRRAVYVPGALRTATMDDLVDAGLDPVQLGGSEQR